MKSGNTYGIAARTADLGPQAAEEVLQGLDLRLPGGAADQRLSPGCTGGHQDILRRAHAGKGQTDLPPRKAGSPAEDLLPLLLDLRAKLPQGLQMQVDGPFAQIAAAGKTEGRLAGPGQQRTQEEDRGAHTLHQIPGNGAAGDLGSIYVHPVPLLPDAAAQLTQDLQRRVHIQKDWHPAQLHRAGAEQTCRKDRKRRVFRALDPALAFQSPSPADPPQVHKNTPRAQNQAILCTEGDLREERRVKRYGVAFGDRL